MESIEQEINSLIEKEKVEILLDCPNEKTVVYRYAAIWNVSKVCQAYYRRFQNSKLIAKVVQEKLGQIPQILTKKDLEEFMEPAKPIYIGGRFVSGRFLGPVEELMLWSLSAAKNPLVGAAADRLKELL